jgi:hypothetical protein
MVPVWHPSPRTHQKNPSTLFMSIVVISTPMLRSKSVSPGISTPRPPQEECLECEIPRYPQRQGRIGEVSNGVSIVLQNPKRLASAIAYKSEVSDRKKKKAKSKVVHLTYPLYTAMMSRIDFSI